MNPQKEFRIYSFFYKPIKVDFLNDLYIPVWAGKNNRNEVEGFCGDDSGDHISAKNNNYSELTGLYWVWKNTQTEIVGSCHYRRYFTTAKEPLAYRIKRLLYFPSNLWKKRYGLIYTANINYWGKQLLNENDALKILEEYDAILPVRRKLRQTIKQHYSKYHSADDLVLLENILKEKSPEFIPAFNKVLNQNRLFANNMFVLRRVDFEELMEWLFDILFKFENRVSNDTYKGYQERIYGFLSERLITVWVEHKKLKYKELPLIYFKKLKK
ncbi:DUF4422 domain-containing protein [Draconibacterium sp.]|uniref:DUF4422 domain-containing protein n=1 Tax=Draconibacterium sp. TaxID=1965318 RepID=UPI0035662087